MCWSTTASIGPRRRHADAAPSPPEKFKPDNAKNPACRPRADRIPADLGGGAVPGTRIAIVLAASQRPAPGVPARNPGGLLAQGRAGEPGALYSGAGAGYGLRRGAGHRNRPL